MLYSIKNRYDLENLNELNSLKNQVEALSLQDKLVKQKFHENVVKVLKLVTKSIKDTSQDETKTITETSFETKKH